jgi:DNA-binding ferritin-like protein
VNKNIDELAERIVTIGYRPLHAFSDFLSNASLQEIKNVKDGKQCVSHVINGLGMLIGEHRKYAADSDEAEDIVTTDMLTNSQEIWRRDFGCLRCSTSNSPHYIKWFSFGLLPLRASVAAFLLK